MIRLKYLFYELKFNYYYKRLELKKLFSKSLTIKDATLSRDEFLIKKARADRDLEKQRFYINKCEGCLHKMTALAIMKNLGD